ncbi:hypothetical protein C8R44DRAFT_757736 [Mycena epipterygia]|nr:hypothetical protein C8R44DRAFT_757736 [Mycena epipterygia]
MRAFCGCLALAWHWPMVDWPMVDWSFCLMRSISTALAAIGPQPACGNFREWIGWSSEWPVRQTISVRPEGRKCILATVQ